MKLQKYPYFLRNFRDLNNNPCLPYPILSLTTSLESQAQRRLSSPLPCRRSTPANLHRAKPRLHEAAPRLSCHLHEAAPHRETKLCLHCTEKRSRTAPPLPLLKPHLLCLTFSGSVSESLLWVATSRCLITASGRCSPRLLFLLCITKSWMFSPHILACCHKSQD